MGKDSIIAGGFSFDNLLGTEVFIISKTKMADDNAKEIANALFSLYIIP